MNLKLKKVDKETVVDYGTPEPSPRLFEQKFQMYIIVKDFKRIFKKKLSKSPNLNNNSPNTERNSLENRYYKNIFSKYKLANPLETLKEKFKNMFIKSNENLLPSINHPSYINSDESNQNLYYSSPFMESIGNNLLTPTNFKTNVINNDKKEKKINLKLINNISKTNEEKKNNIYDYDYIKYKKINKMRNHHFKLKYRDYIKRKIALYDLKNNTSNNNNFNKTNFDSLKIQKNKEMKLKSIENSPSQKNNSDYFSNFKFNDFNTMKHLKTKNNFFQPNKINMFDINNQYFHFVKKILNKSPVIKLHNNIKESQKKINNMKTRYILRRIIK